MSSPRCAWRSWTSPCAGCWGWLLRYTLLRYHWANSAPERRDWNRQCPSRYFFDALDRALRMHILEERSGGYAFRHPVVRAALYDDLPRHRRDELRAALTADPPDPAGDSELAAYRRTSVHRRRRLAQIAHAISSAAADTAALLEESADLVGRPMGIDYPAAIKRCRVLANQATRIAERWEERP